MKVILTSEPRLLHILRSVVRYRAQETGFPEADVECLAMAIDEAVTNVIRHTYENRSDAWLGLEILTFPDRIEFVLEDHGPKVQADAIQPRPLEEVRPGGLGTFFIQRFMDASRYEENVPQGNRLRLVKFLPGKVAAGDEGSGQERG